MELFLTIIRGPSSVLQYDVVHPGRNDASDRPRSNHPTDEEWRADSIVFGSTLLSVSCWFSVGNESPRRATHVPSCPRYIYYTRRQVFAFDSSTNHTSNPHAVIGGGWRDTMVMEATPQFFMREKYCVGIVGI